VYNNQETGYFEKNASGTDITHQKMFEADSLLLNRDKVGKLVLPNHEAKSPNNIAA
jgi:hypothetical protein